MIRYLFLWLFLISGALLAQEGKLISGTVIDQETGSPIEYATLSLKKAYIGTQSNLEGKYEFRIPESAVHDTLMVSVIGYERLEIAVSGIKQTYVDVRLKKSVIELQEVVILPLTPEEYLLRALRKFNENYENGRFQSLSYYQEEFKENGKPVESQEAIIKTDHRSSQEKSVNYQQILLYREPDTTYGLQFQQKKMDRKNERKRKKAEKDGEEYSDKEFIDVTFFGPNILMNFFQIQNNPFLDTNQFKEYEFYLDHSMEENNIMIVGFKTKGTVFYMKQEGKIYLDNTTDALIKVNMNAKVVLPMAAKTAAWVLGYSIKDFTIDCEMAYQRLGNFWYPSLLRANSNGWLIKRKWFSSNEKSEFDLVQTLGVNRIMLDNLIDIPEAKRYTRKKPLEEQVFNDLNLKWHDQNVMKR